MTDGIDYKTASEGAKPKIVTESEERCSLLGIPIVIGDKLVHTDPTSGVRYIVHAEYDPIDIAQHSSKSKQRRYYL